MKLLLVPVSLLLVFLAPAAGAATGPAGCTQLLDSAGACIEDGCYSVWVGRLEPEVCPQFVAPGCEPGTYGACTYTSDGDRCVRVQVGYHHAEECISPRAQPRAVVAPCTPPVSQFGACVQNGCAIVDGPMLHKEACPRDLVDDLVGPITYCTPGVSQFQVCVALPCSTVDGPAMHRVVCVPAFYL